jgi:hypothetical protein
MNSYRVTLVSIEPGKHGPIESVTSRESQVMDVALGCALEGHQNAAVGSVWECLARILTNDFECLRMSQNADIAAKHKADEAYLLAIEARRKADA